MNVDDLKEICEEIIDRKTELELNLTSFHAGKESVSMIDAHRSCLRKVPMIVLFHLERTSNFSKNDFLRPEGHDLRRLRRLLVPRDRGKTIQLEDMYLPP